jgi:hypothetical protein
MSSTGKETENIKGKCYRNNMVVRCRFVTVTLLFLSMGISGLAQAAACDADADGDVDRLDLGLIIKARDTKASGSDDPRDADRDGTITILDARTCVRQCNLPKCLIVDPTPPPPANDSSQLEAPRAKPDQKKTIISSKGWKVERGDTLYAIGRAVYPGDARKQARLRQDIVKLNPSVFANGSNNMDVGVVLKLPDYVVPSAPSPKTGEPGPELVPVPTEAAAKPVLQPAARPPVVEPEPVLQPAAPPPVVEPELKTPTEVTPAPKSTEKTKPKSQLKKEPSVAKEQPVSTQSRAEGGVLLSLGFAYGGDELVETDGMLDVTAGSGVHLRLGYDNMPQHGSGYRLSIGLQYSAAFDQDEDASFRDTYLQLAYQYRANPFVYGVGVVSHLGAKLENESTTTDYDAAIGAIVYLENVGSSNLAGLGLSYTSLDIEEKDTGTSVDASRIEVYYNWRF